MFSIDDPKTFGPTRLGFANAEDVDLFVEKLGQFERGEIDSDAWRAFRLVNGVYGQRQDAFMMIRVKIPQGVLGPAQLSALADVAERCSNGKGHVTTRQNVQFHFVKRENAEEALRRLAAAGLTTREACGNAVRNVTTCPFAGVSATEPFDVTPHAEALTRHLLRGPWSSDLPRKFKIAFGGCCATDCVSAAINDLGFHAVRRGGEPGFRLTIGGGTATLPRSGFVAHEFLPVGEILDAAEAVVRVFHRLGNRQNKSRARLKFVIEKLGREGFLAEYGREREAIRAEGGRPVALPPVPPSPAPVGSPPPFPAPLGGFADFARTNVRPQKQRGLAAVTIRLPLGDVTAEQLRALAVLTARHGEGEVRTTHDQNIVIRFVPMWQLPALHRDLAHVGLALPGVDTAVDVTSCPGAASCKLAVTASRGVARLVSDHLASRPDLVRKAGVLAIKVSGCPNGCGQHHVAGIGLQGGVRKIDGRAVPVYHLLLGGGIDGSGATFGRFAGKIPARRVPAAVDRLVERYDQEKSDGESPERYFARVDLVAVESLLADLMVIDGSTAKPEDYIDLGDTHAFEVEVGSGECAA